MRFFQGYKCFIIPGTSPESKNNRRRKIKKQPVMFKKQPEHCPRPTVKIQPEAQILNTTGAALQLSSSASKFFSKLQVLRHRRSGGRTELSDHQNTGNFAENPNSMVPRAGFGGLKRQKMVDLFPRAKRAVYVKLVEKTVFRELFLDCRVTKR